MGKINNINLSFGKSLKINKPSVTLYDWASKNDIHYYKKYLFNSHYDIINNALRNNLGLDLFRIDIAEAMDRIFNKMPKEYYTKTNEVVYRGISTDKLPQELKDIITKNGKTDIFVDKAFTSTSRSLEVAKQFTGKNGILLIINLPPASKRLDAKDIDNMGEEEVTLPRNSKFRVDEYNPETKTAKLTYLGQQEPLPIIMPEESFELEAELDKIAQLNKLKL